MVLGRRGTLDEYFFVKVRKTPSDVAGEPCWTWLGACTDKGYAIFGVPGRGKVRAARWAWERFRSPIPAALTVDHMCRNTSCVNPAHMEIVTRAENRRRQHQAWLAARAA